MNEEYYRVGRPILCRFCTVDPGVKPAFPIPVGDDIAGPDDIVGAEVGTDPDDAAPEYEAPGADCPPDTIGAPEEMPPPDAPPIGMVILGSACAPGLGGGVAVASGSV